MHHVGKNGKHFIKSNQHLDILHAFINYVRATFNHGFSPSEVDWGDPKGDLTKMSRYTSSGCMLMEVDWGGKVNLNYTSSKYMLMEVDWGDHGSSSNHMTEILLSEVDWGALDSSCFLFLVNIDYDAKPKDLFSQELWGELSQRTSSTSLIGLNHVKRKLVHHLAIQKGPNRQDH